MFIHVTDTKGVTFMANISVVKMVRPTDSGSTLTAIDGTSITIKETLEEVKQQIVWAIDFDERCREGARPFR